MISNRNATAADSPKILVVEDSYLMAEMIGDFLHDCGLEPVGPVGWLQQGCQLARECALDGAVLDVKLHEALCFPVAAILKARDVPAPAALSFDQRAARGQHPELSPATEMPSHGYREGRTLRRRYSTSALP
jgi:CheY-like chemotaxis protein